MWQTSVYLDKSLAVFSQPNITQPHGNLLQLKKGSSVYAESSQFSGSIIQTWDDPYVIYKDCKFSPGLQVPWAQSMSTVYVATSCVALPRPQALWQVLQDDQQMPSCKAHITHRFISPQELR